MIHIICEEKGGVYTIFTISDQELEEGYRKDAEMCFQIDTKRYIYHITFLDESLYTGINSISETSNKGKIYDLSGRLVKNPNKGIYIQNEKKYIVK